MLELVKFDTKASPTTLSEEQYQLIETMFTMGKSRAEVIKIMNFDESYYYRRLNFDIRLDNAEKKGKNMWLQRVQNDIPSAIVNLTFGQTRTLRKVFKEIRKNEETGKTEEVVTNIIEEEKYFPGNSALVGLLAKQVVPNMMNDSTSEDDYDKLVNQLSFEDKLKLEQIAVEVFKNV
jgi:hypothetical protein